MAVLDHRCEAELCNLVKALNEQGYISHSNYCGVSLLGPDAQVVYITPRIGERFYIKDWEFLRPEDIVAVDLEGRPLKELATEPAIELNAHLAVYKARKDVKAIAHIQSEYTAAYAAVGRQMDPVMVEDVKTMVGGETGVVLCQAFAPYGSAAYDQGIVEGLGADKKAVFLQNNGAICVETSATELYCMCTILERQSNMIINATALGNIDYIDIEMTIDESIRPSRKKKNA